MQQEATLDFQQQLKSLGLTMSGVVAITYGFLYTVGYLIYAATLRNYGIHHFEAVRPVYLEVGITFTLAVLIPAVVAILAYLAHFRIRRRSGLPHYLAGAIGYFLNTCHIFYTVAFFCIFMTQSDFLLPVPFAGMTVPFYRLCLVYAVPALASLVLLPILERIVSNRTWSYKFWYSFVIEPIRWFAVIAAVVFQIGLFRSIPWLPILLRKGLAFIACTILLYFGVFGIVYWIRKVARPDNIVPLAALSALGMLLVCYLTLNAYVWGVVRAIPMNRGGKLPVTSTTIFTDGKWFTHLEGGEEISPNLLEWGPVFLVDEGSDFLYVTKEISARWLVEWVPIVAVRKDHISHMVHKRLELSSPRIEQER